MIEAEIGIADITRPGLWFEYAPLKHIYVGMHGLFRKLEDCSARCRLKVGGQTYEEDLQMYWRRHMRSTMLIHVIIITESFDKKKEGALQDVSLKQTQCLDATGWSHYLRSQPWQDGVKFNHGKSDDDISHKLHLLELIDFWKLEDSKERALTREERQVWFLAQ